MAILLVQVVLNKEVQVVLVQVVLNLVVGCGASADGLGTWWCMWCLCMCSLNLVVDIVLVQVELSL